MSIERAESSIREGDPSTLQALLEADPELAQTRLDNGRSLLHVATDWPGHWPNVDHSITALLRSGADPDVRFPHPDDPAVAETPLHWAASSGDVVAMGALLDGGATVDVLGGIFGGCAPLPEAIIFEKYDAARLLLACGATNWLAGAAALGLTDQLDDYFDDAGALRTDVGQLQHWTTPPDSQEIIDRAFQFACRAGHLDVARTLHDRGADPTATMPGGATAAEEAAGNGHRHVIAWLDTLNSS